MSDLKATIISILNLAAGASDDDVLHAVRRARLDQASLVRAEHALASAAAEQVRLEADNTSLRARLFAVRIQRDRAKREAEEANEHIARVLVVREMKAISHSQGETEQHPTG